MVWANHLQEGSPCQRDALADGSSPPVAALLVFQAVLSKAPLALAWRPILLVLKMPKDIFLRSSMRYAMLCKSEVSAQWTTWTDTIAIFYLQLPSSDLILASLSSVISP